MSPAAIAANATPKIITEFHMTCLIGHIQQQFVMIDGDG
jgi:hypothetical protein